jgi:GT2 family glycosyltransferase
MTSHPSVSVLVVAFGDEPRLGQCFEAILASSDVDVEIVVVDNGDLSGHVAALDGDPRARIMRPGRNLGFASGCNLAAQMARGEVLALVNPDVIVAADTLVELATVCARPGVGLATASLRLMSAPTTMNSAGNPVHYLGLAWAGGHGDPAGAHDEMTTVASASGACCAIRADRWHELGGVDDTYFAYHEDVDLSIRCWQHGWCVMYVPTAVAVHDYEFARHTVKNYLLERNRIITVLTTYSGRTLLGLAIPLLAQEIAILTAAAAGRWLPAKVQGYRWLVRHWRDIRRRHRLVQADRVVSDPDLAHIYAVRFEPGLFVARPAVRFANVLSGVGGRTFRRVAT